MPELPEIFNLAKQMENEFVGKEIINVEVLQEKCLNTSVEDFTLQILNKSIISVEPWGKWIFIRLESQLYLLLCLGMGGNVIYHKNDTSLPNKYQLKIKLNDESSVTIGFWWFGYLHLVKEDLLKNHKLTCNLGISPANKSQFTCESFCKLLEGKRCGIKSFLMNQKNIAGIGNVYIQDILFRAKIHPARKINTISDKEKSLLYSVICEEMEQGIQLAGLKYEKDLYGRPGKKFDFLVGYKEGKLCPVCGNIIKKITVANTASYICDSCQV